MSEAAWLREEGATIAEAELGAAEALTSAVRVLARSTPASS